MTAIRCPQCGELRKFEDVLAGDVWLTPPCWNCGHEIPPRPADDDLNDGLADDACDRSLPGGTGGSSERASSLSGDGRLAPESRDTSLPAGDRIGGGEGTR